jgi:hypothetical protein
LVEEAAEEPEELLLIRQLEEGMVVQEVWFYILFLPKV